MYKKHRKAADVLSGVMGDIDPDISLADIIVTLFENPVNIQLYQ